MTTASTFIFCVAALTASVAAQAQGVRAVDVPRVSDGSTGFIGTTESVHTPRRTPTSTEVSKVSRIPTQAGEASTMVNGQPNGNSEAPTVAASSAPSTNLMGAGSGMAAGSVMGAGSAWQAPTHPQWGTPD